MALHEHIATRLAALCGALSLLAAGPCQANASVRRCEDAGGRITYSNESCPSGTAHERAIEDRPAVEVPTQPPGSGAVRGVVPSAAPAPDRNPEHLREVEREQNKSRIARCDDLTRRIEYGQQDLIATTDPERASVELGVRRLQEEHKNNCAPR